MHLAVLQLGFDRLRVEILEGFGRIALLPLLEGIPVAPIGTKPALQVAKRLPRYAGLRSRRSAQLRHV